MPLAGIGPHSLSIDRELISWAETAVNLKRFLLNDTGTITDISTILQYAVDRIEAIGDSQGVLFIPAGIWQISSTIDITGTGLTILGTGPKSIIRLVAGTALGGAMFDLNGASNIEFRKLRIDGNTAGAATTANGINIRGTTDDVVIEDCIIENFPNGADRGDAIRIEAGDGIRIVDCTLANNAQNGIEIDTPGAGETLTDVLIADNFILGNDIGILIRDGGSATFDRIGIQGNQFSNNTTNDYDDNTNVPQGTMLPNNIPSLGGGSELERAKIQRSGGTQNINNGVTAQIVFDSEVIDSNGIGDTGNDRLVIQTAGDYMIGSTIEFVGASGGTVSIEIRVNGTSQATDIRNGGTLGVTVNAQDMLTLAANDLITAFVTNQSGIGIATNTNTDGRPKLWAYRIG